MNITADDFTRVLVPAWCAIQQHHPDLPSVAFAQLHAEEDLIGSVIFPGEQDWIAGQLVTYTTLTVEIASLIWSAAHIFETLLHEAVHVLDGTRHPEVIGTRTEWECHTASFIAIAAEVGLGISVLVSDEYAAETELLPATVEKYADAIAALDARLIPIHAAYQRELESDDPAAWYVHQDEAGQLAADATPQTTAPDRPGR